MKPSVSRQTHQALGTIFAVAAVALWRKRRSMAAGILRPAITPVTHFIVHVMVHVAIHGSREATP